MTKKLSEKEWLEDFADFATSESKAVPEEVSKTILQRIQKAVNPSPWLVFVKLIVAHGLVGTLNLGLCSQFGMSPFNTGFSLSDYFMKFGHSACMVFCGVTFISLTVILCHLFWTREEFRVFSRNAPLQVFALSVFSLVSFLGFGAEMTLHIAVLWLAGALLGGLLTSSVFNLKLRMHKA